MAVISHFLPSHEDDPVHQEHCDRYRWTAKIPHKCKSHCFPQSPQGRVSFCLPVCVARLQRCLLLQDDRSKHT